MERRFPRDPTNFMLGDKGKVLPFDLSADRSDRSNGKIFPLSPNMLDRMEFELARKIRAPARQRTTDDHSLGTSGYS